MNIILIPPADKELDDTINFYSDQFKGLGDEFYNEFIEVCRLISRHPVTWRKIGADTRKINIRRFPFLVLYIVDGNDILITCIAHQHRNPTYYVDRIK